ncbi:hypothetical protein DA100_10810 [Vibrio sp. Hep-1b-8]|nr:hypothetical protein DA100_10810 [Vibrio sp. Hep-1b-8]
MKTIETNKIKNNNLNIQAKYHKGLSLEQFIFMIRSVKDPPAVHLSTPRSSRVIIRAKTQAILSA